jgi:pentapeptide MXKDX repeat protein
MKKLLTLLFAAAIALSMSAFAQDAGSGEKKDEMKKEEKAEKKAKKKKEKKEEKKDEMKKDEAPKN